MKNLPLHPTVGPTSDGQLRPLSPLSAVETPPVSPVTKPPTVVFFDHTAKWSGGEISLFNLVTHLDTERFRPLVVLFEDGALRQKLEAAGIETRVVPLDSSVRGVRKDALGAKSVLQLRQIAEIWRFVRRLRRLLHAENAQIVHCNSLKADLIGGMAARYARVPAIWHIRDRIAEDYLPSIVARTFRLLARWIPTQIITVSQATLDTLQLPPKKRAVAIHNGTVLEKFNFGAAPAPFSRPAGVFTVGIIGRLAHWKGQHIFLRAAALVKEQFPQARFQIVGSALFGEDEYEAQLGAQTTELGLDEAIDHLGFRSDVPEIVAQIDVLAHASITGEPFGQVLIEGMAAGKPIVATDGGGVPEIVLHGRTGFLVPMNDVAALAEAILKLVHDPDLARALGRAGRLRAVESFSIEATARRVQDVYDEMLGRE